MEDCSKMHLSVLTPSAEPRIAEGFLLVYFFICSAKIGIGA